MIIRRVMGALIRRKIILLRRTFFLIINKMYHINSVLSLSFTFFCYKSFIKFI